jgi:hypothetical protein
MPPEVTTVSPRRMLVTISRCALAPLLLRPQEQEIEDHEHQQDRHQLNHEIAPAAWALGESRGDEHETGSLGSDGTPKRSSAASASAPLLDFEAEYSGMAPVCNRLGSR